ncbi:MAG: hypothetical protein KAY22_07500 [Rhizorhabdus sp.]|uniref:hypothetical protein n=1 Tax=Rhizorhabdus sp. TaxID=1968843 RepID=UPI001B453CF4|nr:hypothetical protein [Rhizorhabdus sp.]MBP8232133.1 hypothetical protein [Rhizorhabdus sp.]
MLIEQAFLNLPEILHGSGYQTQEYEGGIIGAFSLAVLQALNGHNTPNPIACIQVERPYRPNGQFAGLQQARHFRADFFLNISRLRVASSNLGHYGWRHFNWLEGKFFRRPSGTIAEPSISNRTHNTGYLLADFIRLTTLLPEPSMTVPRNRRRAPYDQGDWSSSARYLLHVYDAEPLRHLVPRDRPWVKSLIEPGRHTVLLEHLETETETTKKKIGDLAGLRIEAHVTNTLISPVYSDFRPSYYCCLTRIDTFETRYAESTATLLPNRSLMQVPYNALETIAAGVAQRLGVTGRRDAEPPVENTSLDEFLTDEIDDRSVALGEDEDQ